MKTSSTRSVATKPCFGVTSSSSIPVVYTTGSPHKVLPQLRELLSNLLFGHPKDVLHGVAGLGCDSLGQLLDVLNPAHRARVGDTVPAQALDPIKQCPLTSDQSLRGRVVTQLQSG